MPVIELPEKVKSVKVWHCNYDSFAEIGKCINLEVLIVATLPEVDFAFLKNCKALKYLSVVHLPNVKYLDQLAELNNLESIHLSTLPSWDSSGKVTVIDSLSPLAKLEKLRHLELFGIRPDSKSPMDLVSCKLLLSVRLSKYSKELANEFYKISGVSNDWAPEPEIEN